jgi:hypothetical protein
VSLNEQLECSLRVWASAARADLNYIVPSSDVVRNLMNQGVHLYAVSARLLAAAECVGELTSGSTAGACGSLHAAMEEMEKSDQLWGSVTTGMRPSHEYVTAARELHIALTNVTHDELHPRDIKKITEKLNIGQALVDLRYVAQDVADLVRDVQHLPIQLARSGLLFAPARKLTPSVERLHERAAGKYVSPLPDEISELANTIRSLAKRTDTVVRTLGPVLSPASPLRIAKSGAHRTASVPEV